MGGGNCTSLTRLTHTVSEVSSSWFKPIFTVNGASVQFQRITDGGFDEGMSIVLDTNKPYCVSFRGSLVEAVDST